MPRRTVFIETSIPSYYYETRTTRRAVDWRAQTRRWWEVFRPSFNLVTSNFVLVEFASSPPSKARHAAEFFAGIPILEPTAAFDDLVERYVRDRVMPADALGDAAHLAIASLHAVDVILTWNCRHLANANKRRHIEVVNTRAGLSTPMIVTPFELEVE